MSRAPTAPSSPCMSSSPTNQAIGGSSRTSSVAKARWRLLSAALLKQAPDPRDFNRASIHRFTGFKLLKRRQLGVTDGHDEGGQMFLKTIFERLIAAIQKDADACLPEIQLEEYILALQCCSQGCDIQIPLPKLSIDNNNQISRNISLVSVRERLARRGISCHIQQPQDENKHAFLRLQYPMIQDYALFQYHLNNGEEDDSISPLFITRERLTSSRGPSSSTTSLLRSLTSHQHNDGVDNTGNTCVWDSEMTLSYCLLSTAYRAKGQKIKPVSPFCRALNMSSLWDLREQNPESTASTAPLRVLELGAGMAGLAGLSLVTCLSRQRQQEGSSLPELELVLTDGHTDAVHHNRVTVCIQRAFWERQEEASQQTHCHSISCEKLLWTDAINPAQDELWMSPGGGGSLPFDVCLGSDCTHFQEFHACLALTCARHVRVGGVVILCQPARGRSLLNFMTLIQCSMSALWEVVHWWKDPEDVYCPQVYQSHQRALREQADRYDPNVHYPQLVVLRKRRDVTLDDRRQAVQHVKERDEAIAAT